jgi:putative NADH-flavin reductase
MKIALIGATGFVGKAVLEEAESRGHDIIAISRNPENVAVKNGHVKAVKADVLNASEVKKAVEGVDAVISAYNPGWTNPNIHDEFLQGAQAIQEGVKQSGVKRLLVVGGAGSLYVADGVQLIDTPQFPAEYKAGASAAKKYLDILKKENELDWTFLSPAIELHQGNGQVRTGKYRSGLENPVFNEQGRSIISVEDMAIAIVDEIENPKHIKQRFTVAY